MHWLLLIGFIAAHLLSYFAAFRHLRVFTGERMIFFYHGLAFAIVFAVVVTAFAIGSIGFPGLCGLLALQFIYSISFLELWSLAQGSYSLQILTCIARQTSMTREELGAVCAGIGSEKKRRRFENLLRFKLAGQNADGYIELSFMGRMFIGLLRTIMRFTTIRDAG